MHVLGEIVHIVKMDDSLLMGFDHLRRKQQPPGEVLGYLTGHVVALNAVDGRILVGIFLLDFLVVALDQAENAVVGGVGLPHQLARVAVGDVFFGDFVSAVTHDFGFDDILDFLHRKRAVDGTADGGHTIADRPDLRRGQSRFKFHGLIGFADRDQNFFDGEIDFRSVAFYNLHKSATTIFCILSIQYITIYCGAQYNSRILKSNHKFEIFYNFSVIGHAAFTATRHIPATAVRSPAAGPA
ncbi:hypothetical protein SDC9_153534 [bioreactor metagenome]|uniref:Uncharacterized protein n=1 Tax=bioreactor metagenome TaxID=1076179 RepID=A0A645EW61_9ZZZZ